jgi:hypothetical protein
LPARLSHLQAWNIATIYFSRGDEPDPRAIARYRQFVNLSANAT